MSLVAEAEAVRDILADMGAVVRPWDEVDLKHLDGYVEAEQERARVLLSREGRQWRRTHAP